MAKLKELYKLRGVNDVKKPNPGGSSAPVEINITDLVPIERRLGPAGGSPPSVESPATSLVVDDETGLVVRQVIPGSRVRPGGFTAEAGESRRLVDPDFHLGAVEGGFDGSYAYDDLSLA